MLATSGSGEGALVGQGSDAIRVFIVAPVRVHREAVRRLLHGRGALEVVGTGRDDASGVALARELRPDLVLIDTSTAVCPAAIRAFRAALPDVKVVALGVPETDQDVIDFAEAGVSAYVTTEQSVEELVAAVEGAARGEALCSPRAAAALLARLAALAAEREPGGGGAGRLTAREQQILRLIDRGLSNKEIARELFIEVATVKNHVHHILGKLEVSTRSEAAAILRSPSMQVGAGQARLDGALTPS
jgi:two-component system nitrate/nitrite response regulator NarL